MGGLFGYAAADLHCRAAGGSERADSGGAPSGAGGAWVDHGYLFDAAGLAGLVNHKVCKAAFAVGGDRVWGIGLRLMLSNAQKSAGTHTQNPVGWRCRKHDKNPTRLDVGSAAVAVVGVLAVNDPRRLIAGAAVRGQPSPDQPLATTDRLVTLWHAIFS